MTALFGPEKARGGEAIAHRELVERAGVWLRRSMKCSAVLLEPRYGTVGEIPDAIGWSSGRSILVECKASRSDFLADQNKPSRRRGSGWSLGTERWYFAPAGMIDAEEVPPGWGLAVVRGQRGGGRVFKVLRAPKVEREPYALALEIRLLSGYLAAAQWKANEWISPRSDHAEHNFGADPLELPYEQPQEVKR